MSYNLNNTITNLWNRFSDEFASFDCMKRMPNYSSKPIKGKLLFIGLNPAFQNKNKDSLIFTSSVSAEKMNEIATNNDNSKTKTIFLKIHPTHVIIRILITSISR